MQSIFVVATGQDVGKTTTSIGLVGALAARGYRVGFLKPVGQQYVMKDDLKIDKDAVLMQTSLHVSGALADMSPVTVPRGFVEDYLFHRDAKGLQQRILECHEHLKKACDVLVVEGTGHAGVGSCFDLSNAEVARLLGTQVVVVVEGGIGSALDQFALNLSLFEAKQVKVLGVIANKVFPEKRERIAHALEQGLKNMGHRFLGAMPYDRSITYPRVSQIADVVKAEVLSGEEELGRRVENIIVAAMEPQNVLPRLMPNTMMITPGDRIDNILVALNSMHNDSDAKGRVVAVLLTGGFIPHFTIMALVKKAGLPVLLCKDNTYEVSAKVQHQVFKITPADTDKIEQAQKLVRDYVDIEAVLAALQE